MKLACKGVGDGICVVTLSVNVNCNGYVLISNFIHAFSNLNFLFGELCGHCSNSWRSKIMSRIVLLD